MTERDTMATTAATAPATELDQLCINTLRTLAIDMVQKADSGHPGTPMGAAPTAYCLWQRFLNYDPHAPAWPNRDRFVLSPGHACALLYGLLYLGDVQPGSGSDARGSLGKAVTLDEIKSFQQLGSRCTGHPEHGWTTGVETTTGPLGQGVATSVGMAIAEAWLAATYNRPGFTLFDHKVYALASDGDMMEGISAEAASLAGHLQLANLCWIYDCNRITIEGATGLTFTEDVGARFETYGWRVLQVADANAIEQLSAHLQTFALQPSLPTLIVVQSHIGYGAPHKQDAKEAHGEALGEDEVRLTKEFYGWNPDAKFLVPSEVPQHFKAHFGQRGARAHAAWNALHQKYQAQYPDLAQQLSHMQAGTLPEGWDAPLPSFEASAKGVSSRDAAGKTLNAIAKQVPWVLGGAADLSPSTKTALTFDFAGVFEPGPLADNSERAKADARNFAGRNFHFGIREHAMCAAVSGMALAGLRPFGAGFLIFTDYARGAMRLAAMMGLPVTYIWTHDSIALGEDGPTHQPIEQLASLRAMPGMRVLRPADANETVEAWRIAMQRTDGPTSLVLSRQALPTLDRTQYASAAGLAQGAYVLADCEGGSPEVLLLATGSEVALCIAAYEQLKKEGVRARVVSMPSWDLFECQDSAYQESVLPDAVQARVSVEAGSGLGWDRYVGRHGAILAMHSFGMSAPGKDVMAHFGFDAAHVVRAAQEQLRRHQTKA